MTIENIDKVLASTFTKKQVPVVIHFKKKSTIQGVFIQCADFEDLKKKNFWRFVQDNDVENWNQTRNRLFERIICGTQISKIKRQEG